LKIFKKLYELAHINTIIRRNNEGITITKRVLKVGEVLGIRKV